MEPTGPRKHRSRRNRPCDFCRARKVACKIETSPPCQLCCSKGQLCTFEEAPGPRKRRKVDADAPVASPASSLQMTYSQDYGLPDDLREIGGDVELEDFFQSFELEHSLGPAYASLGRRPTSQSAPSEASRSTGTGSVAHQRPTTTAPPLEQARPEVVVTSQADDDSLPGDVLTRPGLRYVGPSGDLDPFLLAHRTYDKQNASLSQYTALTYQRVRPLRRDRQSLVPPAVFALSRDSREDKTSSSRGESGDNSSSVFYSRIDNITASGLIALFLRFVHPYLPIVSRRQLATEEEDALDMPLCLLSAICATAIPFVLYDDALCVEAARLPTSEELFDISWAAVMGDSGSPSLAKLQAHLLLMHRHYGSKPQSDDPSVWSHCCQTVSIAQVLGLNDDPSTWTALPGWERRLRKRLWWAVWVMEKWTSFGQGMPSHLHQDSFTVQPLTASDLADCESHDSQDLSPHFLALVQLTCILDDIVECFFTMRASIQSVGKVQESLLAARTFRARLKEWNQSLPEKLQKDWQPDHSWLDGGAPPRLNGNASLRIAFFATQLSIFRALIRPISMDLLPKSNSREQNSPNDMASHITPQFISATIQGAISALRDLIAFVGRLTTAEWDAFWPGWSQHNFALASTLLMHCYLIMSICKRRESRQEVDFQQPAALHFDTADDPLSNAETSNGTRQDENAMATSVMHNEVRTLAQRWRWLLRLAARGAAGKKNLMDRSLLRIDALLTEWNRAQI